MNITLKQLSSLEKVFLDSKDFPEKYESASALKGERFSYQVAYTMDGTAQRKKEVFVTIDSPLAPYISLRRVGYVPSELPAYPDLKDEDYLRTEPGLYPDPLYPITNPIDIVPKVWHSLFVTIDIPQEIQAGKYDIMLYFKGEDGEELDKVSFCLSIINAVLPPQELIYTQWFHADCIASVYGYDILSEPHWEMIGQFMRTAVSNGINMLLTPIFTLPLDTKVGGERPTLQLVDVKKMGDTYTFYYDNLKRWIELAKESGIRYFEISHLFSQWGAKYAPKVVAEENGEIKRIFGWDTDACCPEYQTFLMQFLPSLTDFLKQEGLDKTTYFHISDEPQGEEQKESYRKAKEIVKPYLEGYPVIDALSEYAFYDEGIVAQPIPSTDHIVPFLEKKVPDLWCYYCCVQGNQVSNRFFSMPSYRNRIIGAQLYLHDIKGFLQWGYNFYYSQHSKEVLNPYLTTDGMAAFPSGDAFGVYPGKDGPIEGLSLVIFHQALQDLRAFKLLEALAGREAVEALIQKDAAKKITFFDYPRNASYLLNLREQINQEIENHK